MKCAELLYPEKRSGLVLEEERKKDRKLMTCAAAGGGVLTAAAVVAKGPGTEVATVLVLTVVFLAAVPLLRVQRRKEAVKERRMLLEEAFSELVSKLSVLMGAGASLKNAWERIVSDYRKEKGDDPKRRHPLYEEMDLTLRLMRQGFTEEEALTRFGERTGLPCYLRLVNLLESRQRTGMKDFCSVLSIEAREAFEHRLTLARRRGEKISSKLLMPMIVLFALVVMILIIPAFLSW